MSDPKGFWPEGFWYQDQRRGAYPPKRDVRKTWKNAGHNLSYLLERGRLPQDFDHIDVRCPRCKEVGALGALRAHQGSVGCRAKHAQNRAKADGYTEPDMWLGSKSNIRRLQRLAPVLETRRQSRQLYIYAYETLGQHWVRPLYSVLARDSYAAPERWPALHKFGLSTANCWHPMLSVILFAVEDEEFRGDLFTHHALGAAGEALFALGQEYCASAPDRARHAYLRIGQTDEGVKERV